MTTTITQPVSLLSKLVNDTLNTLAEFSNILEQENAALRKSDFKTLDTLQADKRLYAAQYHDHVTKLTERGEEMRNLDIKLKEKLVVARTEFTLLLQENMKALENMKNSTQRLANRILEVARQSVTTDQQTGYSAKGQVRSYASSTRSLSVDQSL